MRKAKKIKIEHHGEFELDLAPLLAVMVKLVPVLLISSAFVQAMVIETELPQVVSEAIQKQDDQKDATFISLDITEKEGIKINVTSKGQTKTEVVKKEKDGSYDLQKLHSTLVAIKKQNPEVFKIDLNPDESVPYDLIVKIMDEARQAKDQNVKFPVFDSKQGKNVETKYMFPEIIFANTMEG